MTSHEWCGNSFVEWRADRAVLAIRSYFETPGDTDAPLSAEGALFYDALPLVLRGLDFQRTRRGSVKIIDSVFSSRPSPPGVASAELEVSRGSKASSYRVRLHEGAKEDVFEFDAAFPHRLLQWDRRDGGSLRLTDSRRFRYWEKNAPGDERLMAPSSTR